MSWKNNFKRGDRHVIAGHEFVVKAIGKRALIFHPMPKPKPKMDKAQWLAGVES